jgi:lipopolysaccharide biosynthesis regulator YciM
VTILGVTLSVYQSMLLAGFLGLVVGYLLSLLINRGRRTEYETVKMGLNRERVTSNAAFMRGLNYILSDDQDQAIEELTRAVNVDTDAVETYVALGNLFRSKGEIDRAIRIRQSIIVRNNIAESIRRQAKFDLGLDYRRGGFYERAIKTFQEVLSEDPKHTEALHQLVLIYEETRDWEKAFETEQKMAKLTGEKRLNVLAHHQTEIGKAHMERGRTGNAKAAFKKALSLDPTCVDAHLHFGDWYLHQGKPKKALAQWRKVVEVAPDHTFLVLNRLALAAVRLKDFSPVEEVLTQCVQSGPNPLAHLALARMLAQRGENDRAINELNRAIELDPAFMEAHRELGLLLLVLGRREDALEAYRNLLNHLESPDAVFRCARCGFEASELYWRCPQCYAWDAMSLARHSPVLYWTTQPAVKDLVVSEPAPFDASQPSESE